MHPAKTFVVVSIALLTALNSALSGFALATLCFHKSDTFAVSIGGHNTEHSDCGSDYCETDGLAEESHSLPLASTDCKACIDIELKGTETTSILCFRSALTTPSSASVIDRGYYKFRLPHNLHFDAISPPRAPPLHKAPIEIRLKTRVIQV